jgi:hypothetical protein
MHASGELATTLPKKQDLVSDILIKKFHSLKFTFHKKGFTILLPLECPLKETH